MPHTWARGLTLASHLGTGPHTWQRGRCELRSPPPAAQAICYELGAPKDEVVSLILNHPSVLTGRELRLSVADMAHLAMLREPRGRVVD